MTDPPAPYLRQLVPVPFAEDRHCSNDDPQDYANYPKNPQQEIEYSAHKENTDDNKEYGYADSPE